VVSELGGAQMSTLLESLPGIANVLRSPVADALVGVIRAAARLEDFELSDAEELLQYASRRGLMDEEEGVRILQEVEAAYQKRMTRAADRAKHAKAKESARKKSPYRRSLPPGPVALARAPRRRRKPEKNRRRPRRRSGLELGHEVVEAGRPLK
jgi:hypothetical protein